jgi:hypothetical protein
MPKWLPLLLIQNFEKFLETCLLSLAIQKHRVWRWGMTSVLECQHSRFVNKFVGPGELFVCTVDWDGWQDRL